MVRTSSVTTFLSLSFQFQFPSYRISVFVSTLYADKSKVFLCWILFEIMWDLNVLLLRKMLLITAIILDDSDGDNSSMTNCNISVWSTLKIQYSQDHSTAGFRVTSCICRFNRLNTHCNINLTKQIYSSCFCGFYGLKIHTNINFTKYLSKKRYNLRHMFLHFIFVDQSKTSK